MTRDAILALQLLLLEKGFAPGPADGLWGAKTAAAVQAYGAALRLPTTPPAAVAGAMLYQGSARYPVREICIHCTATQTDWMAGKGLAAQVAEIRLWHVRDRGWRDIGYHWIIGRDGSVLPGRRETEIGAGVEGHNTGVIHCTLIGGHDSAETDAFRTNYTAAQDAALRKLIGEIKARSQISLITGHNQYAAKACPGFYVPNWLKEAA